MILIRDGTVVDLVSLTTQFAASDYPKSDQIVYRQVRSLEMKSQPPMRFSIDAEPIDELVEVAVRSLSPGINDPFTAINCIDRLGAALGRLSERELPSAYRYDEENALRIITRPVAFGDVLDAAFNQIRQYSRDSVAVTIRMLESFASIAEHVCRVEDRESVRRHAEMTARASDLFAEEYDRVQVRQRLDAVKSVLGEHA